MNFDDPVQRRGFFEVHSGPPREGPGNRESIERALLLAGDLSPRPRVLDIACGPGMQTIDLLDLLPTAQTTAIDGHAPFLMELRRRAVEHGQSDAYPNDALANAVLGDCTQEIAIYRDYASFYGYVFLIMSR